MSQVRWGGRTSILGTSRPSRDKRWGLLYYTSHLKHTTWNPLLLMSMSSYADTGRDYAITTPGPLSGWQGGGPNITPNQSGYPATLTWPHSLVSLQRTHNSSDVSSICQSETGRWRRPPDERRSLPRHQRRPSSLSYSTRHFTQAPCGEAMWSRGGQVPDCPSHRLRSRQTHHVGKNVRIRAHRR